MNHDPLAEALCIVGGPRSGKTSALIDRARAWCSPSLGPDAPNPSGTEPSALLFCATPTAAQSLEKRWGDVGGTALRVTTPLECALSILEDPRAARATGRVPHVMDRDDEAIFFEDLKTSGLKQRRLRELWGFLLCGLANLDDDNPAWIQTTEERAQLALAHDILAFDEALLAGEAVNLAVHALRAVPSLRASFGAAVVLADDYPLMSRASQEMITLLARERLAVAGSETLLPAAFEPWPSRDGLKRFAAEHRPCERVVLDEPFPTLQTTWQSAETPSEEMAAVVDEVSRALAAGIPPARIAVVATNGTWRANTLRALQSCGVAATSLKAPRCSPLGHRRWTATDGDRRRLLERLAQNPDDSLAWRQWLALGDPLARSAAVSELRTAAPGLSLSEALRRLADNALEDLPADSPFAQNLLGPYREALALIEQGDQAPVRGGKECDAAVGAGEPATVRVGHPADLVDHTFDRVIFGGFVNGFIPTRSMVDEGTLVGSARERALNDDRALLRLVRERTAERLVLTGFATCPLEAAEQLKLAIARIQLKNGQRLCTIEPSIYLPEMLGPTSSATIE